MKKYFLISLVFFLVIGSFFVFSKQDTPRIQQQVIDALEEKDQVSVIIKLRDPESIKAKDLLIHSIDAKKEKKEILKKSQDAFISGQDLKKFRIKHIYGLTNSIAAQVSKESLESLRNDPDIEEIYYDMPVHAFLNDSALLMNTSAFWNIALNNLSVNGTGEAVCIIDTGIDYTHPALGGCNLAGYINGGTREALSPIVESSHPYSASYEHTWEITKPGYTKISVHFMNISLESSYDYLEILDSDNASIIATYTGIKNNFWSPPVDGDTLYVKLISDESVTDYGFIINETLDGTYNDTLNWSSCQKVIGGWDIVNSDSDPLDDEGHGTHVAGIVASINNTYRGIAPGAKIVALKSLDSNGNGYFSDIDLGIEWCIDNADRLNISVISMSLGAGNYTDYCDTTYPSTSALVGQAVSQGIMVVVASGNNGQSRNISTPACLRNVTSVGATTKADAIDTSYSQSDEILDIIAPGTAIKSALLDGGYVSDSGTSMATPHAAAAAILIRNFKRLENGTILTPGQIETILKATGKNLTDSRNSMNFARINLTSALRYIDDTPRITFTLILANNSNLTVNHTQINFTSSEPLSNVTIERDGVNRSMNGSDRYFYYNNTGLSEGRHNFTVHIRDTTSNRVRSGLYVFNVDTLKPNITDIFNESLSSGFIVFFNTSEAAYSKIQYGTASGAYTGETYDTTGYTLRHNISITGLNSYTTYYYILNATDSVGLINSTAEYNYTTGNIDLTYPSWSGEAAYPPSGSTYSSSASYQFNVTWTDNEKVSRAWIEHNFNGSMVNHSVTGNQSTTYYYNYPNDLAAGTYSWKMHANDTSDNINSTSLFTFTVAKATPELNITLNGTEGDTTVSQGSVLNITVNSTGDRFVYLYLNNTLISNSTRPSNRTTFSNVGQNNVTATYPSSQNYTTASKTLWVTVTDALPPEILILTPDNNTLYPSSAITVNISLSEAADCSFRVNLGAYNTTSVSGLYRYRAITLADGNFNLSVNCTDPSGYSSSANVKNFTVDSTSPVVNLFYPTESLIVSSASVELNYSVNESNLDKLWFTFNYNSSKNSTTPSSTNGGPNLYDVVFDAPGKQVLTLYANDTSGNIDSTNITFIINSTMNITKWETNLRASSLNISTIQTFNSSWGRMSGNIEIDRDLSLQLNFSGHVLDIYNFTGRDALWDYHFSAVDNSTEFEELVNDVLGASPLDYLSVTNFSVFIDDSDDYFAKIKMPHNISYYSSVIYYCSSDSLSDCTTISACSGTYLPTTASACYNTTATSVYVYVPHLSSVFGINDSVAPIINITTPTNGSNSLVNSSYLNPIIFSTNENATCNYSINSGTVVNAGTTNSRYFTGNYTLYTNSTPLHNLTVNCADRYNNARSSRVRFKINDTTAPTITIISETATTSTMNISFSTNEPANWTVRFDTASAQTYSGYANSSIASYSDLDEDTRYYYNITACDHLGNCAIASDSKYTDSSSGSDGGSSGGGSGGGGSTSEEVTSVKASQQWTNPSAGQYTMNIPTAQIALTQLIFTLRNDITGLVIFTAEKISSFPSYIQAIGGNKYQLLKIDKSVLKDSNFTSVILKFRVTKTWVSQNTINPYNISLYRYTTQWDKLDTKYTNSDGTYYYYEATSPGLSYFAIKGELLPHQIQVNQNSTPPTDDNTPTGNVVDDGNTLPVDDPVTPAKKGSGILMFILVPFIILAVIGGGAVTFIRYQNSLSVNNDGDLSEIKSYVQKCKEEGIEFSHIRDSLLKVGWSESVVDLVMRKVDIPNQEMERITGYIKTMKLKGRNEDEIKGKLAEVGWQNDIIAEAFAVVSKETGKK